MRETMNLSLPPEVANRIKNTVYWSHGWTIGEFVTAACNRVISEIEQARGNSFPDRGSHLMRKGPQGYLPRTKLLDLEDWLVAPENRHEAAISVLREAVSQIIAKTSSRNTWLEKEMETLLNMKLHVDTMQVPSIKRVDDETKSQKEENSHPPL